jgi:ABC-type multidrug transport system fused ATPase/permease subunit
MVYCWLGREYCQAASWSSWRRGEEQLRGDLFNRLEDMPLNYFDSHTHGELMSRFANDADNVQMRWNRALLPCFQRSVFIGLVAAMLYTCQRCSRSPHWASPPLLSF